MQGDETPRVPRPPREDLLEQMDSVMRAVLASAAGLIPQPWGLIIAAAAGYLAPLFPSVGQRRLQQWGKAVAQGANALRARSVDVDALAQNEEFTDLVLSLTEVAMRTRHEAKHERLRNVLVNAALLSGTTEARLRMFVRTVDELDEHHVALLTFFADPHAFMKRKGLPVESSGHGYVVHESIGPMTERAFRSFGDRTLIDLAIDDLIQRKLATFNADVECRPGHGVLTPLGREFVGFIAEPPPIA